MNLNEMPTDDGSSELIAVENSYWVAMKNSLMTLESRPGFNELVIEGYFTDKVNSLLRQLIDTDVMEKGLRNSVIEQLVAVARLQDYFSTIKAIGGNNTEEQEQKEELEFVNKINKRAMALQGMETDSNFIKVVLDGFIKDHAVRQTTFIAVGGIMRIEALETLSAISHFNKYLMQIPMDYAAVLESMDNEETVDE
jgi:hypothetical protein